MRRPAKAEVETAAPMKVFNHKSKASAVASDKENEKVRKEMAKIDAMELSDIESPKWATAKNDHVLSTQKRYLEVEEAENGRRKVSDR